MKKILVSTALICALSSSLMAENDGYFAGLSYAYGSFTDGISLLGLTGSNAYTGHRFGLYGGYTDVLDSNLALRYYGTLDFGTDYTRGRNQAHYSSINLYANADAIYKFLEQDGIEYSVYGGLALGLVNGKYEFRQASTSETGLGLGINLGARINYEAFGSKFSTELYTRTGLIDSVLNGSDSQIGIRTSYLF